MGQIFYRDKMGNLVVKEKEAHLVQEERLDPQELQVHKVVLVHQ